MASTFQISAFNSQLKAYASRWWPLVLGLLVLVVPSMIRLGSEAWTDEAGVHGPIVLVTGIWLLVRAYPSVRPFQQAGNGWLAAAVLVSSLLAYVFGRAFGFLSLETLSIFVFLYGLLYLYAGGEVMRRLWFPLTYLLFVVPLPGWLIDQITSPLKTYVSWSATHLLELFDYPVAREGVTLYVDQYQLLVEDACAGLNSIVSLTAIGLFYIYVLHNSSWRYALFLLLWILPAALIANLVRVIILVLITYHMGNEAAQGFLHSTAGLIMFVTALLTVFLVDGLMTPLRRRWERKADAVTA